jgi:hypothetical protein
MSAKNSLKSQGLLANQKPKQKAPPLNFTKEN